MRTGSAVRTLLIATVVIVGGLLALAYPEYQRDIDRAYERALAGSRVIETRCGPIEYAIAGEGPPMLVVHGAGGGYDQGLEIAGPLVQRGVRLISVSRFGYLRTPLPADASARAQADAHVCLLDALGIERVALLGISAGAPSSMQFAIHYPHRLTKLILLVPATYVPRPDAAPSVHMPRNTQLLLDTLLQSDLVFWAAIRLARDAVLGTLLGTPPGVMKAADDTERARAHRLMERALPVSPRRTGMLNDAAIVATLTRLALEQITSPTLVIGAADDQFGIFDGARYTAAQIPGARLVSYPSGGHLLIGHQAEVLDEIGAFVQ